MNHSYPLMNKAKLKPYWCRKTELSFHDDYLLWGSRIIIPPPGREVVLGELHAKYPAISRMKTLARLFVWWPGMDGDTVKTVQSCHTCQQYRPAPPPAPLQPSKWPSHPWTHMFLVVVDAYLKWLEVFQMPAATSRAPIQQL